MAVLILLFRPEHGGYWRWQGFQKRQVTILCEDTIKYLYNAEYNGSTSSMASLAGALGQTLDHAAGIVDTCQRLGLVALDGRSLRLTPDGRQQALHVIRVHRLLECYLADRTGVSPVDWHIEADRLEHGVCRGQADLLEHDLGYPTHDPHGDPIPTASGALPPHTGTLLSGLQSGQRARFTHIEDEPPAVYAQLSAMGVVRGETTHILDCSEQLMVLSIRGTPAVVSKLLASYVTVSVLEASPDQNIELGWLPLAATQIGQVVTIRSLTSDCRGLERTRLLDLGFVPGSKVENVMVGPLGDPTVYLVRGALVALRASQAKLIGVILN